MLGEEKQLLEKDDAESVNDKDGINLTKIITDKDKNSEIFTSNSSKENLTGSSSVSSLSNSDHTLNNPVLVTKLVDEIINDNSTSMLSEIMKNGNVVKNTGNLDLEENSENSLSNCNFIPSCNAASHESSLTLQRNCVSSNENCDSFQNHTGSENINTGKRKREEPEENRETKVAKIDNEIASLDVRKRKREDADKNLETKVLKTDDNDKSSLEECISSNNEIEEKKENLVVNQLNALSSKKNVEDESFKDNSVDENIENECEKMSEENKEEISSEKRVDSNDRVEDPEENKRETQGGVEVCNKETITKSKEPRDNIHEIKNIKENYEEVSYDKEVTLDEHSNEHDKILEESEEKVSDENRVCTPNEHVDHEESKNKTQDDNVEDINKETADINESQNKICKKETMKEINEKVPYDEEKTFDEHDKSCEKTVVERDKEVLNESSVDTSQEDVGSKEIKKKKIEDEDVEDSSEETTAENEESLNKICEKEIMKENSKEILHNNKTKNLDEDQKEREKTSKENKEEISENRVDTPDGHVKDPEESEKETPEKDVEDSEKETPEKDPEDSEKETPEKDVEDSEKETPEKDPEDSEKETPEKDVEDSEKETPEKDPEDSEKETPEKDVEDSNREATDKIEEPLDKSCEKKIMKENSEVSCEKKGETLEQDVKDFEENQEKTQVLEESTRETVSKFNESEDGTSKKINKEAEEEKSYERESKGEIHNEENIEDTQNKFIEDGNHTLEGSEEEIFCSDKFPEELEGLEKNKNKAHNENKEISLKSKEENMEISKETKEDNDREINDKSEENLAENVESHKATQQNLEKEAAAECKGREIDIESSLAVGENEKELDEDHIKKNEDKNDDNIMSDESTSKAIEEFEGFENKSTEDLSTVNGNDDKEGTELDNIIIGEAFTINEEQMSAMDNLKNEEPIQSSQSVSATVKATSIRRSAKDGSSLKKKSLSKSSRRYKKITFQTKKKKKYVYSSASSAAQYIPVKTELYLPLFLEELANIDPKLIVIRDRYNEDGKKFKVHCLAFHETILDWAMSETLLSSFDNSKTLRKKLKLKMNGHSMFPENLEPKIGETHPVALGNAFPFAMPRVGVKCESDAAEEVRLSYPLEQLCDLCPSALGSRDTEETKPSRLNSVLFADEPLEWAFKETFLSSFEDSPILSDLLGFTSSTTKWPDVTEEILSNEGVDFTFPFACPNSGKRMYESLLFSNLSTDLPSSLLHETLQLPPLPSNIEKTLYGERDALVRLLAIASFYKHSSCIPTVRSNRKLSSIHSALIESFRPLIISQANKLAIVIRKAREWLLKGVTCQDASIIPAMIDGPVNSKRGILFSHLQKLESAVAKDPNNKLQNM